MGVTNQQCKTSDQFMNGLRDEICKYVDLHQAALLLMSQNNVGTYGTQPLGNQ